MGGDLVKVVTGVRRCGKSFLLFNLFRDYLLGSGVKESHIIGIALDDEENKPLRNPIALAEHIRRRLGRLKGLKYLFIDEIQLCYKVLPQGLDLSRVAKEDRPSCYVTFYDVLNEFRKRKDVDVYVTGSNSKMLSSDIATEFRGRSDEVRLHPLSFVEYMQVSGKEKQESLEEYLVWGGLPAVVLEPERRRKEHILKRLFERIYIKDIVERRKLHDASVVCAVLDVLSSAVGSLTNPNKLVNTLSSQAGLRTTNRTLTKYLGYLEDAFLFAKAERWDVRGKKFLDFPCKYYAEDTGLRNARLNFRQQEITHIMENVIYDELRSRDYLVDVGLVECREMRDGKQEFIQYEVDFVVTNGIDKYYIQSAYALQNDGKQQQELNPLRKIGDSFQKIVIQGDDIASYTNDDGIIFMGLHQFLMNSEILK